MRSELYLIKRKFSLSYTTRAAAADPMEQQFLKQLPQALDLTLLGKQLGVTGGGAPIYYKLQFIAPRGVYENADPTVDNFVKYDAKLNLLKDGATPALRAALINTMLPYA